MRYMFHGMVSLGGVVFCIEATTLEEAKRKACEGDYSWCDTSLATIDCCAIYHGSSFTEEQETPEVPTK